MLQHSVCVGEEPSNLKGAGMRMSSSSIASKRLAVAWIAPLLVWASSSFSYICNASTEEYILPMTAEGVKLVQERVARLGEGTVDYSHPPDKVMEKKIVERLEYYMGIERGQKEVPQEIRKRMDEYSHRGGKPMGTLYYFYEEEKFHLFFLVIATPQDPYHEPFQALTQHVKIWQVMCKAKDGWHVCCLVVYDVVTNNPNMQVMLTGLSLGKLVEEKRTNRRYFI